MVDVAQELELEPVQLFQALVRQAELAPFFEELPVEPSVLDGDARDREGGFQELDVDLGPRDALLARPQPQDSDQLVVRVDRGEEQEPRLRRERRQGSFRGAGDLFHRERPAALPEMFHERGRAGSHEDLGLGPVHAPRPGQLRDSPASLENQPEACAREPELTHEREQERVQRSVQVAGLCERMTQLDQSMERVLALRQELERGLRFLAVTFGDRFLRHGWTPSLVPEFWGPTPIP